MTVSTTETTKKRELEDQDACESLVKKMKPVAEVSPTVRSENPDRALLSIQLPGTKCCFKVMSPSSSFGNGSYITLEGPVETGITKKWPFSFKWADLEFLSDNMVGREGCNAISKEIQGRTVTVDLKDLVIVPKDGEKKGPFTFYTVSLSQPDQAPVSICFDKESASGAASIFKSLHKLGSLNEQCQEGRHIPLVHRQLFVSVYQSIYRHYREVRMPLTNVDFHFDACKEAYMELINRACDVLGVENPRDDKIEKLRRRALKVAFGTDAGEETDDFTKSLAFLHDCIRNNMSRDVDVFLSSLGRA